MDEVVLKMLEQFDTSRIMGGFNYNKCMEILHGFRDEIMNDIGGDTGGTSREVEQKDIDIGVILGSPRYMNGVVQCTFFHRGGS